MTTTIHQAPRAGAAGVGKTPPRLSGVDVRDALGGAQYERMRQAMAVGGLFLPAWDQLTEPQREPYRRRTEYLVPAVADLLAGDRS